MPAEGKVHWSIKSTEFVDGDIEAVVEIRVGSSMDPLFSIVRVRFTKGMTLEESRMVLKDACYKALRQKREEERAQGVVAKLPNEGIEDFSS